MGFRHYDPSAGRFLTRDPIGYAGGINLYAFCANNPVNYADPTGFCPESDGNGRQETGGFGWPIGAGTRGPRRPYGWEDTEYNSCPRPSPENPIQYQRGSPQGQPPDFTPKPDELAKGPDSGPSVVTDSGSLPTYRPEPGAPRVSMDGHPFDPSTLPDTIGVYPAGADPNHFELWRTDPEMTDAEFEAELAKWHARTLD